MCCGLLDVTRKTEQECQNVDLPVVHLPIPIGNSKISVPAKLKTVIKQDEINENI